MQSVLAVDGLTGGYSKAKPVLHQLSFAIQPGEMIGLIGLNGAGKSTTIKHILGLMQPQQGSIRINGASLEEAPLPYREAFAYVPESPLLYDELTVKEHLELTALAYGLERATYEAKAQQLAEQFQMTDKLNSFSRHLSKGMKQKVMIMNAFLVQPKLFIIDEPFLGLDPLGIRALLDLLVEVKREGAAILMSSHILATIEKYCDRFLVLHHGRLVASGPLPAIQAAAQLPGETLEEAFYSLVKDGSKPWT